MASGSKGNSTYIGTANTKILIDVGVSGKRIQEALTSFHMEGNHIDGIFITHEHADHVKGAGIISRRFHVPIYATEDTWLAMEEGIGKIAPSNKKFVYAGEDCKINDLCVRPFSIPHDAADPVGYTVFSGDKKISVATDIGHVTKELEEHLMDSQVILIEANHDEAMVRNGEYPRYLKERILGENGHLSNHTAGDLLGRVMSERLKHIYLGHLSDDNNYPTLALRTVAEALSKKGIIVGSDIHMELAYKHKCGTKIKI